MTILYILISTDPLSGSTKSFLMMLKGVLASGTKAIVVVPDREGIYDRLREMGVEVIVEPSKGNTWTGAKNLKQILLYVPRQIGRLLITYRACRRLEKKLQNRNIDLIHSNNSVTNIGRYLANALHMPHLIHIREYGDWDFGLHYFPTTSAFQRYLKTNGVFTACITRDIQRHHGLSKTPSSRVIYNGIIEHEDENGLHETKRNFYLYAGRIEPTKGLLDLVRAYAEYVKTSINPLPLKVAGEVIDHRYWKQIRRLLVEQKLEDKVQILGKITDMTTLYQHAKAIIICSEYEGFGRCMPEAMSYGCLAIAKNTGGTKEQLDNGRLWTGQDIGLRYTTTQELTELLIKVGQMKDEDSRMMREYAFRVVSEHYSVNAYVKAILNYYTEIART